MEEEQKSEGFNLFGTFVKYDHLFLVVLLIAAYLRFSNGYVANLWPDEARDAYDGYFLYKSPLDFMHIPSAMHPPFFPYMIMLSYFVLGFGDGAARTVAPLMGTLGVAALYLWGGRIFNKKVALLASLLLAAFWLNVFISTKTITDIIIGTMFSAALLAFYVAVENPGTKFLGKVDYPYAAGALLGLSFLTKEVAYILPFMFLAYLAITGQVGRLKSKKALIAIGIALLLFLPWAYRNTVVSGDPFEISKWKGQYASGGAAPDFLYYVNSFTSWFGTIETYLLVAGLVLLLVNLKGRPEKFLLVWLLMGMAFFSWYGVKEPRFLMPIYPAFALAMAYVPEGLKKLTKMDGKILYALAAIVIIVVAASNSTNASAQVAGRASGYSGLKEAGVFIGQNSKENESAVAGSIMQIRYYSLRETLGMPGSGVDLEKLIAENNVKYVVIDTWEPYIFQYETPAYIQNNTARFALVKTAIDENVYRSQGKVLGALVYEVKK